MIKPGKNDIKVEILIAGRELEELQKHTWSMDESFELDNRIDSYQGKKPIGLYRWDLECLIDVLDIALDDPQEYPSKDLPEYQALNNLYSRLKDEFKKTYG